MYSALIQKKKKKKKNGDPYGKQCIRQADIPSNEAAPSRATHGIEGHSGQSASQTTDGGDRRRPADIQRMATTAA
eukprot:NODE_7384_length_404_cov_29.732394_g5727_i0.p3 GENE.NODE_7384_length_404_cov_29.732394_g5727_i0~~NODE_7384_length_404_cov_29.732394_g5727_i0.p3  ORF type:complete len:75 (+),score=16.40 NODE_7384_length_404_cov_29.732394_g5727_i0:85-309(+)